MPSRGESNFPRGAITSLIVFVAVVRAMRAAAGGGGGEEILRSERNGGPVMGSLGSL